MDRAAAPFLAIAGAGMLVGAAAGVTLALFGVLSPVPMVVAAAIIWLLLWLVAAVAPASRAARRYRQRHPTT